MVSRKPVVVIFLAVIIAAIGAFAFAAERSSHVTPIQRSVPVVAPIQRSAPAVAPVSVSPKVTVTFPMAGVSWKAGSNQTIAWSYAGNIGPSVSIYVLRGRTTVYTLSNAAPLNNTGKGTFNWTIPKDAIAGKDYSIVIASNMNPNIKGVSGIFSLSEGVAKISTAGGIGVAKEAKTDIKLTALITVSQPSGSDGWAPGTSHLINWDKKSGDKTGNVNIDLLKGNSIYRNIAKNVPLGNLKYNWLIPADLPLDQQYRIQIVKTTDSNVQGTSDFFSVVNPGIEILTPHSNEKWPSGEAHELKWRVTGIPADPKTMVTVDRTSWDWPGQDVYDLATDVPMTTESYQLKLTTPPGGGSAVYMIRVMIVDPATKKQYKSTIENIYIQAPFIEITNLAELTAASWIPGNTYKVSWKIRGNGYPGDITYAISDETGKNIFVSSTQLGGTIGTYEWTVKAFAKKMKFSITPSEKRVSGTSFVFNVDTGKYPLLSPALTAPPAPSISATLIDYKQHVALQWKDNSGNEKEFIVERKNLGGKGRATYAEIGRVPANATSYQDKSATVAGPYRYRVKAINDNGSSNSNEVDITTLPAASPVDLVPVNPNPSKGPAGYCPAVAYTGDVDITINNLGPVASGTTNALLMVWNKQSAGYYEELKTVIPILQKGGSFVWHAHAAKCLEGDGPECEFNLMINYNPKEVLESDMSTNDIYFTCKKPVKIKNMAPVVK